MAQSSRSLDALLDSTFKSPPVIPPLQLSSSAQSRAPSVPAIDILTPSPRNNIPLLNQFMAVPPADIPLPTLEEGHVPESLNKRDKLLGDIGTKVMPTNGATSRFTPRMPGE